MGKRHQHRTDNQHKLDHYEMTQEGLDEYIRVSRPSVLVVIISLVLVLIAVIVWGVVGVLPVTETLTGIVVDYSIYEQLDAEAMEALENGEALKVAATSEAQESEGSAEEPAEDTSVEDIADAAKPEDGAEEPGGETTDKIAVFCFLDASRYNGQAIADFGNEAVLKMPDQTTYLGTIESRFLSPISTEEAKRLLLNDEWVLEQCVDQNYSWWLIITPKEDISKYVFTLTEVTIVTEEVAPIQFLINRG